MSNRARHTTNLDYAEPMATIYPPCERRPPMMLDCQTIERLEQIAADAFASELSIAGGEGQRPSVTAAAQGFKRRLLAVMAKPEPMVYLPCCPHCVSGRRTDGPVCHHCDGSGVRPWPLVGDQFTHAFAPDVFKLGTVINADARRSYTPHALAVTVKWQDGRETTHTKPFVDLRAINVAP